MYSSASSAGCVAVSMCVQVFEFGRMQISPILVLFFLLLAFCLSVNAQRSPQGARNVLRRRGQRADGLESGEHSEALQHVLHIERGGLCNCF